MQQNDKTVLVYATYPSLEAAEAEGAILVDAGLAACVNILPGMVSVYIWKGTRHRDAEVVLIAKTREALAGRLIKEARARHSYDNPAFLVLPVEGGSEPYLDWIATQTSAPRPAEHE